MDERSQALASKLVGANYISQAADARRAREAVVRTLLEHRKWPERGWDDATIEMLLQDLALMDSNNFMGNVGVGEREARIYSGLVERRYFRLGHGVGRSGELAAVQPKAAGSSLLAMLANSMTLDLLKVCGLTRVAACIVVPMATGMAMVLTLLALRAGKPSAKYVLWPRIDQKSCLKAIITAGLQPLVVPNTLEGDEVRTDLSALSSLMDTYGPDSILCVLSTTSCFAPRAPDRLEEIARLCSARNIGHVINNAYGLQVSKCTHLCNEAMRVGRVDAIVQSTDKNLMVPVGGAIIAGPHAAFIDAISKSYPGRASAGPCLDVFITLLSMGVEGYRELLAKRKELFATLRTELARLAAKHGERLLETKNNGISLALSLKSSASMSASDITFLGSMLFSRCVSGTRVIGNSTKVVCGVEFKSYGAHIDNYPEPYLTAAAAVGMRESDITTFIHRLDKVIVQFRKQAPLTAGPPKPCSLPTPAADPSHASATTDGSAASAALQEPSRHAEATAALVVHEGMAAVSLESSDDEETAS